MSLTELSYYFRKYLPFAILFFVVLMIFYYSIQLAIIYFNAQNQPVIAPYYNPIFDKFKKPTLKEATTSANFTYILDTLEGVPVTATTSAKVFLLPISQAKFGYREKIYLMAKTFGFDIDTVKHRFIDDKKAEFNDGYQKLVIDITNFNFSYEILKLETIDLKNAIIPSKSQIENKAADFLKSTGRYPDELIKGKNNIIYHGYNKESNTIFVAKEPQEANVVEIDFYRPDIDSYTVVSPKFFTSQNFVIMTFTEDNYKVLKAQINFFEKSEDQFGIYPVKSGETAWKELNNGYGMVVSSDNKSGQVTIKKMYLGYLDSENNADLFQPVYVFIGTDNFVSYVPAVEGYLID